MLLLGVLLPVGLTAHAQAPDSARQHGRATVAGVARDSIGNAPLAGATIQLVPSDGRSTGALTTTADSLGRYAIDGVPDGRYMLGFFHPMLDSLGLESPLREVTVVGLPVRADVSTPSALRLRTAICGTRVAADSEAGVVVGTVRSATDDSPIAGARVMGEWLELSFTPTGVVRRSPRLVAVTGENGWFALCSVPSAGTMTVLASRGEDSTSSIEIQVPSTGFLRRELTLGVSQAAPLAMRTRADSSATVLRTRRVGDMRLAGVVVAAADGRPLGGASVRLMDGAETRTNERGAWTLAEAPAGTRMLEVRSVGFYPERRPVQVVTGAAPLRIELSTLKAVLDTVKVFAARSSLRHLRDFTERQRTGAGRYLGAADIARRHPFFTSDLLRTLPGVRLDRSVFDSTSILIRGPFDWCPPAVFLDGSFVPGISAGEIDSWITPERLAGLELYSEASVPPQFVRPGTSCGSLVLWSK
jgi:hypothetical protein